MSDIMIPIKGVEYQLRKWPALPGFKYSRALTRLLADFYAGLTIKFSDLSKIVAGAISEDEFKVDPNMIDKVLSDSNFASFQSMICDGLDKIDGELTEGERKALRVAVADMPLEDFATAAFLVIKHNVSFLTGLLTPFIATISKLPKTITQPPLESAAPARSRSTPYWEKSPEMNSNA